MTRYIALLRGINVGRAKRIAMADLRSVFTDLGFSDVATHLQSGNVVFSAGSLEPGAAASIEAAVLARTGVQSAVLLLDAAQLHSVAEENPLVELATDHARLIVTFTALPPDPARVALPDPAAIAPEVLRVGSNAVYHWAPDGVLASTIPPSFWKQLGPGITARNWRTVTKLVELAGPVRGDCGGA